MHHVPAQIPIGISLTEARKLHYAYWIIPNHKETVMVNSRWVYLDFMDLWRWLALNETD